jgi:hypothetical protein
MYRKRQWDYPLAASNTAFGRGLTDYGFEKKKWSMDGSG